MAEDRHHAPRAVNDNDVALARLRGSVHESPKAFRADRPLIASGHRIGEDSAGQTEAFSP